MAGFSVNRSHKFQSTRPRGARLLTSAAHGRRACFNPRAREGRDEATPTLPSPPPSFNPRAREGRDREALEQVAEG